jgi:4-hydroxybenzoate polyprenyltransferase
METSPQKNNRKKNYLWWLMGFGQFISAERGFMLFMITLAATFVLVENPSWFQGAYLGFIVFCGWSAMDAINNIYDVDLDVKSDYFRSEFTRKIGRFGIVIVVFFSLLSVVLGALTESYLVPLFIVLGLFAGIAYSVPPFRLRQTIYKPFVNLSVGFVPILVVGSFSHVFSINMWSLGFMMGISTAVNSLWEDLADYSSDFATHARTVPVVLGVRRGIYATIFLGYCLIPLMVFVGILFELHYVYYVIFSVLVLYLSFRIIQNRRLLFGQSQVDDKSLLALAEVFSKDFVVLAVIQTTNIMISGYLTYQPVIF